MRRAGKTFARNTHSHHHCRGARDPKLGSFEKWIKFSSQSTCDEHAKSIRFCVVESRAQFASPRVVFVDELFQRIRMERGYNVVSFDMIQYLFTDNTISQYTNMFYLFFAFCVRCAALVLCARSLGRSVAFRCAFAHRCLTHTGYLCARSACMLCMSTICIASIPFAHERIDSRSPFRPTKSMQPHRKRLRIYRN